VGKYLNITFQKFIIKFILFKQKLTEEEKKLFRLYGKLPTGKDVLSHKLKVFALLC